MEEMESSEERKILRGSTYQKLDKKNSRRE
jgi:hypothetical protein